METIFDKEDEFPEKDEGNERGEDVQPTAQETPSEEGEEHEEKPHPHHHHGHPHILTIDHTNHGRSNTRAFGIDHEPGAGI